MAFRVTNLPWDELPTVWHGPVASWVIAAVPRLHDKRPAKEQAKAECIQLLSDGLAMQLQLPNNPTIRFNFSHVSGLTWGVASLSSLHIGIDAARDDEFGPGYPLHKAFHSDELVLAPPICLWSVKEAVVKAMGCGWNGKNPLDIHISQEMQVDGFAIEVFRYQELWVAVAEEFNLCSALDRGRQWTEA